jgi:hypothetical protein
MQAETMDAKDDDSSTGEEEPTDEKPIDRTLRRVYPYFPVYHAVLQRFSAPDDKDTPIPPLETINRFSTAL